MIFFDLDICHICNPFSVRNGGDGGVGARAAPGGRVGSSRAHCRGQVRKWCSGRSLILIQASSAASGSGMVAVPKIHPHKEETWMNFYTQHDKRYGGIDLHARAMYVCILDQHGTK